MNVIAKRDKVVDVSWWGEKGFTASVQEIKRDREGMAII